jgi:MFS family permease
MAWDSLTQPALFAIVGDSLPPQRRATGFAVQSVLRRLPTIVAPPVGGILIAALGLAAGVRLGLAVTIALALLAAFLVWRFYIPQPLGPLESAGFCVVWRGLDRRLKRLLVADILARWAEGIPRVFIVIYVMDVLGRSAVEAGWLITLQRMTSVLVYLPLAPLSDRMSRKPFVLLTFAFFALFPLALANASGFLGLAAAFVIAGLGEVGEPARKALIVDLAGKELRGRTIGMYYLLRNLSVFPAALVGGLIWSTLGPQLVFFVAFSAGALGFLTYAFWGTAAEVSERMDPAEIVSASCCLQRGDVT